MGDGKNIPVVSGDPKNLPESSCNLHSTIEIADVPAGERGPQKTRISRLALILAVLRYYKMGHPGTHLEARQRERWNH